MTKIVDVLVADRWPNYSICGLPYLRGGQAGAARTSRSAPTGSTTTA